MLLNLLDENFLDETEKFTNHLLNKKDDVQQLITVVANLKREEEFNELIFTAKYLKGLLRVVNKAPSIPEVESIEQVEADISENMKKVLDQLRGILSGVEESKVNLFEENYVCASS